MLAWSGFPFFVALVQGPKSYSCGTTVVPLQQLFVPLVINNMEIKIYIQNHIEKTDVSHFPVQFLQYLNKRSVTEYQ